MTTTEPTRLGKWLDEQEKALAGSIVMDHGWRDGNSFCLEETLKALRTFDEMHQSVEQDLIGTQFDGIEPVLVCAVCWGPGDTGGLCSVKHPCPSRVAIEKAVGLE